MILYWNSEWEDGLIENNIKAKVFKSKYENKIFLYLKAHLPSKSILFLLIHLQYMFGICEKKGKNLIYSQYYIEDESEEKELNPHVNDTRS